MTKLSMKNTVLYLLLLTVISCNPVRNADRLAEKNKHTVLYPEQAFNKEVAGNQLTAGKSTIKGALYKSTNKMSVVGAKAYGKGIKIDLFPVNDYFIAWYKLREKKEARRTAVYMSDEAYSMRLETKTDNYGRFEFKEMKPGKYFLQAFMSTYKSGYQDVTVGTNSYGMQFYQKQYYQIEKKHRVEKFVDITTDGEIVEVKLH